MPKRDIIVVGASAGGVEALRDLVTFLPKDFPASIFIVLHTAPGSTSVLASLLANSSLLPARNPLDDEQIMPGMIYVAPPGKHMTLETGRIRLDYGPRHNRNRPAIDPLFHSAAIAYGPRVIGVVLTGYLDDGTLGLEAIHRHGGTTVVQDPEDALVPDMPRNALENVEID